MPMPAMTSENMRRLLRPAVEDAAESIRFADGDEAAEAVLAWFNAATVEDMQDVLMGGIQDALRAAAR